MNSNSGWLGHLKTWSGPAALMLVIVALVLGVVGLSLPRGAAPGGETWAAAGQACGVYMEQGCMQLTAQSGGEIQMESGSTLDIQAGTTSTFGGALTVSGALAANGGITVDTTNFTVNGTTGAVHTASTLDVDGAAVFSSTVAVTGTVTAVGAVSAADLTASDDLVVGDDATITGTLGVVDVATFTGGFSSSSAGSMNENRIVWDLGVTAYTAGSAGYITMTVPATGTVTVENGDLGVAGYASFSVEPTIVTTNTLLTTAMKLDWQVLQNSGALTVTLTLPAAAAGLQYCVFNYDGDDVMVDPQGGDQIFSLTNAAGDRILNTTAGNSICLLAIDNTYWLAIYPVGTWSDAD